MIRWILGYRYKFTKGVNDYYENKWTGKRLCVCPFWGGYSPVDKEWLKEVENHKVTIG